MSNDGRSLPDGPLKREFDRLMERLDAIDARLDRIERHAPVEKAAQSPIPAPTPSPTPVTPKPIEPQAVEASAKPIGPERTPFVPRPMTPPAPAPTVPPLLELLKERKKTASVGSDATAGSDIPQATLASDESPWVNEAPEKETLGRVDGSGREVPEREPGTLDTASLESFLGGRVAAWVGAIVVVIAAGFFVKFAYDQGWIQKTPPAVRLLIAALFGGLFLGAGEIALRRFGRPAAVGAFGAGVGTLIVTALASARPLHVLSEPVALLASTLIAGLGIGVAWRSRSVAVGGLSILGGLLAPMILEVLTVPGTAVPFHLTAVLALGLGISAIAEVPFRPLRWLAVIGILVAAVPWFFVVGRHTPALSMPIVILWWAMIVAESAWAAVRGQSTKANILAAVVASGAAASISSLAVFGGNRWASVFGYTPFVLAVLAWLTASQLAAIGDADDAADEVANGDERAIGEATAAYRKTLRILTGALIAAGVGVLFRYGGLAVTWAALAIAYMEIGRSVKSRWAFALGLFALRGAILAVIATIVVGFLRGPASLSLSPTFTIILPDGWWSLPVVLFACLVAGTRWMRFDRKVRERTVDWGDTFTFIAYAGWIAGALAMGRDFAISALLLAGAIPAAIALYLERPREWALRTVAYPVTAVLIGVSGLAWWLCAFQAVADNDMPWLALAIPMGIAFFGVLLGPAAERRGLSDQPTYAGTAIFLLVAIVCEVIAHRAGNDLRDVAFSIGIATLVAAWMSLLVITAGAALGRSMLTTLGLMMLSLSAVTWAGFAALMPRVDLGVRSGWPILNGESLTGLALGAAAMASAWLLRGMRSDDPGAPRPPFNADLAAIAAMAVAFLVGTLDAERLAEPFIRDGSAGETLGQSLVSVWWGLCGVGAVAAGFLRRSSRLRWLGLVLLTVTVGKVLLVDMSAAATIWRVVALLIVGLVLVVTSVLYVRVMPKAERA